MLRKSLCVLLVLFLSACASVPKESVELSTTVGRDIAVVHEAHRNLAIHVFSEIKNDVNKFVDEVYAPYQIQKLLQADFADFKGGDRLSLFHALNTAIKSSATPESTALAVGAMDVFLRVVRSDIADYRNSLLAPILAQEAKLMDAIDRSYNQIHYANSIVTGHLASVVKVHDAQDKLLERFGIEGLREETAEKLASLSNKVAEVTNDARKLKSEIPQVGEKIKAFSDMLDRKSDGRKPPMKQ